jgi:hypothetical protein
MSRDRGALLALLALGLGLRLWIGVTNRGVSYDIDSFYIVAKLLQTHPLHVYSAMRWPYPGGYLPVVWACSRIASALGVPLWAVIKVPFALADTAIAGTLWWGLGRLGATPAQRWAGVVLVALGPSMILISGYHGQLDATAILPALLGVIVWQLQDRRRALVAGVLIGLGASFKTVPLFMVLALLPTARSRREAVTVVAIAAAIPVVSVLPFLAADRHATLHSLTANKGIPGWGGLSLLLQPHLLRDYLGGGPPVNLFGVTSFLYREQNVIVALAALATGAFLFVKRIDAVHGAALIWLVVYVVNPDMAFQYWVWGIPFFLLARRPLEVAALQLLVALPSAMLYFHFAVPQLRWLYVPLMDLVWVGLAIAALLAFRRATQSARTFGSSGLTVSGS